MQANIMNNEPDKDLLCDKREIIRGYDFEMQQQNVAKRKYSIRIIVRGVMCLAFTFAPLILLIYIMVGQYL